MLVQGVARAKGFRVRAGQLVEVRPLGPSPDGPAAAPSGLFVVARGADFAALHKPAGMHSALVAGRTQVESPPAERFLETFWPGGGARLLNRLDFLTSGLLLIGFSEEAEARFRELEAQGLVEKRYLAVVQGGLARETTIARALDTAKRKRVRALGHDDADPARRTLVRPLAHDAAGEQTLVLATLFRGARRQIRAHLAALGHPIVGDPEQEPLRDDTPGRLMLHCLAVRLPGFEASRTPLDQAWAPWRGDFPV